MAKQMRPTCSFVPFPQDAVSENVEQDGERADRQEEEVCLPGLDDEREVGSNDRRGGEKEGLMLSALFR